MEEPELDLGLPPAVKPFKREPAEKTKITYSVYTAVNRRFCNVCIGEVDKVEGVPKHAIPKATYTEDGPGGRLWLCEPHMRDRRLAQDLSAAQERQEKKHDRARKKPRPTS